MCGIGGIVRIGRGNTLREADRLVLPHVLDVLGHRGPDEVNVETHEQVALAFTRLSLVGVDDGLQPLTSRDGSVSILANGEVYNHRELTAALGYSPRTGSDCEVLVPLYREHGVEFLTRVRGILAVAVLDHASGLLSLAVDPFANKPLFYARRGDLFVFASEIKALLAHPEIESRIDWAGALGDQALSGYPSMMLDSPNVWFEGVSKVDAGTVVTLDVTTGATSTHTYWQLPTSPPDDAPFDLDAAVADYRRELHRSVQDSLMADVGLGLFLSGGIDSAGIAAIASELGNPLCTYTVATEATILNGDVAAAQEVSRLLGIDNTVAIMPRDEVPSVDDWKRLLWLAESPLTNPEQWFKFNLHRVAKAQNPDLKAILLGAGADEYNGGYTHMLGRGLGWDAFIANIAPLAAATGTPGHAWWSRGAQRRILVSPDALGDRAGGDPYVDYLRWKNRDVQQYNCWLEDRCAAGNGIEARVPFLDTALVEIATRIPRSRRGDLLWNKRIARLAMADLLPQSLVWREKKPFYDGPTARYSHEMVFSLLRQDGCALLEEAFDGTGMGDFIDLEALRAIVVRGQADILHPEFVLRLINLGLLDKMAKEPPEPFYERQIDFVVSSGSADDALTAFGDLRISGGSRIAFATDTRLLRNALDDEEWFLVRGTDIAYTIDRRQAGDWIDLLASLDGRATLDHLRPGADEDGWAKHLDYLNLLMEQGHLISVEAGL